MSMLISLGSGVTLATLAGLCAIRWRVSSGWGRLRQEELSKDLSGKTIVITGGNAGLGYETALELAKRNATIVIGCRNEAKSMEAKEKIEKITGKSDQVHFIPLDLGDLESVRGFSRELREKFPDIYCLVLNAGIWYSMDRNKATLDGYEIHFGVNHLGHFLMTNLLLDSLRDPDGDKPRVVVVSSSLMNGGSINMETRDFLYPPGRIPAKKSHVPTGYADSKLMNAMFSKSLSEKFGDIDSVAVCPGWCYTDLARNVEMSWFKKLLMAPIAFMFMRSAKQGSLNILDGVLSDELTSGGFYRECKLAKTESEKIEELAETSAQLWNLSMELTGLNK